MRPLNTWALVLILAGFASCDPGYRLLVLNTSASDVKMHVVYDYRDAAWNRYFVDTSRGWGVRQYGGVSLPVYDHKAYINFYDSTDKSCAKGVKRTIARRSIYDSACNCISFTLTATENVVLEGGIGVAPSAQKVIFNDTDIVDVPSSKRVRKKPRLWLGGSYIISSGN